MEEWKWVNYNDYSPVYALSLTAERWGLEPLPGNLVATEGYWDPTTALDTSNVTVWTLPYSCADDPTVFFGNSYANSDESDVLVNQTRTLYASDANICPGSGDVCSSSGCLLLVEGIGLSTTGPANSDILSLTCGLTTLFAALAILLIMGCTSSKEPPFYEPEPRAQGRLRRATASAAPPANLHHAVPTYYNPPPPPPPPPQQLYAGQALRRENIPNEVAQCAALLRRLYNLDLQIWGLEKCTAEDEPRRLEYCRQANEVFGRVREMVRAWGRADADFGWNAKERALVEEVRRAVDAYPGRRYDSEGQVVRKIESVPPPRRQVSNVGRHIFVDDAFDWE